MSEQTPQEKQKSSLLSKDGRLGSLVAIIMMVVMALGIAFLGIDNGHKSDQILDLQAQLKIQNEYSKKIQNVNGFAIAEALRVSGSDRIIEALQKEEPQAFAKLREQWKNLQPVEYQKIYIDRPRIDTLIVSKTIVKGDTIKIEFNWKNQSLSIDGISYAIPDTLKKTYSSFTKLNVTQEPLKLIITVAEAEDGSLKTAIACSDTSFKIGEIDTRLAKNFTLKRDTYFMLGGSLGTSFHDLLPKMSVYTGLDFTKKNWSIFLRLDMLEQSKIFEAVSIGLMKKF